MNIQEENNSTQFESVHTVNTGKIDLVIDVGEMKEIENPHIDDVSLGIDSDKPVVMEEKEVEEEQSIRDAFSDDSEQIEEKKEDMIDKSVEGSVQDNPTETLTQNDEDQRDCTILEEPLYSTKVEESVDTSPIYSTIQNAQTTSITDIEDREFDRQLRQQLIAT
ncbi:hypothetical protein ADUPG1_010532, partial [Aduncisulcus paluster]